MNHKTTYKTVEKACAFCKKWIVVPRKYGEKYALNIKYCGPSCAVKDRYVSGGRKRSTTYGAIHQELRKYKKTGKCVFCGKECKTQWALKKEREYSSNIDDYNELCSSCHRKYDYREEISVKISATKRAKRLNKVNQLTP